VVGPQTTRNGVVAMDPYAGWSGVVRDYGLAGTNDGYAAIWHDALWRRRSPKHREPSKGIVPGQNALHSSN
jgi:hypothetical protein